MIFRCPDCRTRRCDYGMFRRHLTESGHKVCNCGGYAYAHRPRSPYCKHNAMSEVREAQRQGTTQDLLLEIAADCSWDKAGVKVRPGDLCPF